MTWVYLLASWAGVGFVCYDETWGSLHVTQTCGLLGFFGVCAAWFGLVFFLAK